MSTEQQVTATNQASGGNSEPLREWDIVSGVGITALAVCGARAAEHQRADRLIEDPFAAPLFAAAPTSHQLPDLTSPAGGDDLTARMAGYLGLRSRVFDEFFEAAWGDGIRQAVILASGLDARAYRLAWPDGFRVFEIDQPMVLTYKTTVLDGIGACPACDHRPVGFDLRDDWATALREAGFDTGSPTAWLAEGLLPYLPAAAQQALLSTMDEFSAPGSRAAIENFSSPQNLSRMTGEAKKYGIDIAALFSGEERADARDTLVGRGWAVECETVPAAAQRYRRDLGDFEQFAGQLGEFLIASRPAR